MTSTSKKILFVGGGSAGHLSIIKGLIDELRIRNYPLGENVLVVGGRLGMIDDPGISIDEKIIQSLMSHFTLFEEVNCIEVWLVNSALDKSGPQSDFCLDFFWGLLMHSK
jgi:hypothetical protein